MILNKGDIAYMVVTGNTMLTSITLTYGQDISNWLRFDVYNHIYNNLIRKEKELIIRPQ